MNYLGYDYLALWTFLKRKKLSMVGNQVGVGKESGVQPLSSEPWYLLARTRYQAQ